MDDATNLYRRLRRAQRRLDTAEERRREAVLAAREAGLTYAEIGDCLAISRQAARGLERRAVASDGD